MGKFEQVLVLEVESAKDKNAETPGGKYRRDTPWLVEAFKKNEETLKKCVTDYQAKLKKQEEKYQSLKNLAEERLQS